MHISPQKCYDLSGSFDHVMFFSVILHPFLKPASDAAILVMTITKRDLSSIDTDYFDILDCNPFHITLRSKNTLHEWHLLYTEYNGRTSFEIRHRHSNRYPYHRHGHAPSLSAAIKDIKNHDSYQLRKDLCKRQTRNIRRRRVLPETKKEPAPKD